MTAEGKAWRPGRVAAVVNPSSGSAGPDAVAEVRRILAEHEVEGTVTSAEDAGLEVCLRDALAAKPDLLIVVAGDGTARAAAELAGPRGPLLAPLPGGTMNMLPRALYGERDWKTAMADILDAGVEKRVSGGEIDGRAFYVAAILGAPALWAEAREAAREGDLWRMAAYARRALRRAFSGSLRYTLDGARPRTTEALTLVCPLVSRELGDDEGWLEAAAIDPAGALEVFRLGFRAALGDWRGDAAVDVERIRKGRVSAGGRIPAVLDGEPMRLGTAARFRFRPTAFRALVPADLETPV